VQLLSTPFVDSVFHPNDLSEASDRAFAHALVVALVRQTRLTIFHAGRNAELEWEKLPPVRRTLERWGLLGEGSERSAVLDELSVGVTKAMAGGNPVQACFAEIRKLKPDLVVLATEGRDGLARWLRPSVAERLARRSKTMTLFVPAKGRGFVDPANGHLALKRILVPVDDPPDPKTAILRATRAAEAIGDKPVAITLLRVGAEPVVPALPESDAWTLQAERVDGDVVDAILAAAQDADLIVMPTAGRDGVLDAFRGSHTERVVRAAPCPVLAVPSA